MFYCPEQWGTTLGANAYSPLMTTDSGGIVRSSYAYNPRLADATNGIIARRYQKISDLPPHNLFSVDYFPGPTGGPGFVPILPSHFREHGWNVLFTDGSVQFSQSRVVWNFLSQGIFVVNQTVASLEQEDFILNCLELDH
jgi:hypothetical protein